jgi:hypothetical protein
VHGVAEMRLSAPRLVSPEHKPADAIRRGGSRDSQRKSKPRRCPRDVNRPGEREQSRFAPAWAPSTRPAPGDAHTRVSCRHDTVIHGHNRRAKAGSETIDAPHVPSKDGSCEHVPLARFGVEPQGIINIRDRRNCERGTKVPSADERGIAWTVRDRQRHKSVCPRRF